MPDAAGPYDFMYVHTDIPDGMTIREWRAQRAASWPATPSATSTRASRDTCVGRARRWSLP